MELDYFCTKTGIQVPREHLMGNGVKDMYQKMNVALAATEGLDTRDCEDFSVQELTDILSLLFSMRSPEFEKTYRTTDDNRRLQANGVYSDSLDELKAMWAEEAAIVAKNPALAEVSRDGRCHDAVMWFTHHLTADRKEELMHSGAIDFVLPLMPKAQLPYSKAQYRGSAAEDAIELVFNSYGDSASCAACHASGQAAGNSESFVWPSSLSYNATAYGAFPFWESGGPGCSSCDRTIDTPGTLVVKYSGTLNSELLMHSSCGDMSWTGESNAPNGSPCNHIFNSSLGAFIYTPKSSLSPEADGEFCCRTYSAGDSNFPGAVPQDWARSMTYWGNNTGYHGAYYTGEIKIYWSQVLGVDFWYYESIDGYPLEQGEGCYFPGVHNKTTCDDPTPVLLWHDYNPASVDWDNGESVDESYFEVPEVCQTTTVDCSGPGGAAGSTYYPILSQAARKAGVAIKR